MDSAEEDITHLTDAINLSPTNRSASINDFKSPDAQKTVSLKPDGLEIEPNNEGISYLTIRAAVYMEMGKFDECIKDCDKAVERGKDMIARALTRKGTALGQMAKTSKDYDPAIEAFQKALTEHPNPDTLEKLNEAEKAKKDLEQQEYFDPNIADEERKKGIQYFMEHKYPEAVKHYSEAIKRNPKDLAYSLRAPSYSKLGAMPEALKDAEKCIELDPTLVRGYKTKAAIQFFMTEYDKVLETCQEGLKLEPNNRELLYCVRRCVSQINKARRGDLTPEDLKERQTKGGIQDSEVQNILTDSVMRQALVDLKENTKVARITNNIQKLINAGIVQVR